LHENTISHSRAADPAGVCAVSCQKSQGSDGSSVVEDYFKALVPKMATSGISLLLDWRSRRSSKPTPSPSTPPRPKYPVQNRGEDGDASLVSCTASLCWITTAEKQEINLADRDYQVVQEGGEWRMCGLNEKPAFFPRELIRPAAVPDLDRPGGAHGRPIPQWIYQGF